MPGSHIGRRSTSLAESSGDAAASAVSSPIPNTGRIYQQILWGLEAAHPQALDPLPHRQAKTARNTSHGVTMSAATTIGPTSCWSNRSKMFLKTRGHHNKKSTVLKSYLSTIIGEIHLKRGYKLLC